LPNDTPGLKAVLSYYSSTVTLNAEGDTQLRDEYIDSLGTAPTFFSVLFGSISTIATFNRRRGQSSHLQPQRESQTPSPESSADPNLDLPKPLDYLLSGPHDTNQDTSSLVSHHVMPAQFRHVEPDFTDDVDVTPRLKKKNRSGMRLTFLLPDPGYFAAGGIAGVISRTATAPLDRLKVYLIANTGTVKSSLSAAKKGDAVKAVRQVGRPLIEATKELWRAGGMRSLFAGVSPTF
jgi:solute carrier family 25 phosphate transporter 23/24/25/41